MEPRRAAKGRYHAGGRCSLEVDAASEVDAAWERERRNRYGEEREGVSGGH